MAFGQNYINQQIERKSEIGFRIFDIVIFDIRLVLKPPKGKFWLKIN